MIQISCLHLPCIFFNSYYAGIVLPVHVLCTVVDHASFPEVHMLEYDPTRMYVCERRALFLVAVLNAMISGRFLTSHYYWLDLTGAMTA